MGIKVTVDKDNQNRTITRDVNDYETMLTVDAGEVRPLIGKLFLTLEVGSATVYTEKDGQSVGVQVYTLEQWKVAREEFVRSGKKQYEENIREAARDAIREGTLDRDTVNKVFEALDIEPVEREFVAEVNKNYDTLLKIRLFASSEEEAYDEVIDNLNLTVDVNIEYTGEGEVTSGYGEATDYSADLSDYDIEVEVSEA